jgi:hypothetical protein
VLLRPYSVKTSARRQLGLMADTSIRAGEIWTDEIREALWHSRRVVLLLTRKSITSNWVMFEVGAAWALELPIIGALFGVKTTDLPEPISERQRRDIATTGARIALSEEIKTMLL